MSQEYAPSPDNPKAELAPGMFCQIRVYKNGEIRVDFDGRNDKIPQGQDAIARLVGATTMLLGEIGSWATQQAAVHKAGEQALLEHLKHFKGETVQ